MIMINQDFENFKNECVEQLSALQDEFMKVYDINSYEHWYYDHGIGAFHFKLPGAFHTMNTYQNLNPVLIPKLMWDKPTSVLSKVEM